MGGANTKHLNQPVHSKKRHQTDKSEYRSEILWIWSKLLINVIYTLKTYTYARHLTEKAELKPSRYLVSLASHQVSQYDSFVVD